MIFVKKLFKKRNWSVKYYVDDLNKGTITCKGNFFTFVIAVIRFMH